MDVALAVVPFADIARPSIGLSLLKAALDGRGFHSRIHYFNLQLAELLGEELYTQISAVLPSEAMVGEWFFADLVFGDQIPPEHAFVAKILRTVAVPSLLPRILDARKHRAGFVERCVQQLTAARTPIVGFTTTFHQTCVCLAIAKRLKEMADPPTICFGGANCEGEMGYQMIRSFPWIDYICTREGDEVFPAFVERFLRQGDASGQPGFLCRAEAALLTYPPMITDMDALPIPNYDDYLQSLNASSLSKQLRREMQFEAARGCWWGAKHHCTFCGLNGATMPFRSKSPARVYDEIKHLYVRYGLKRIDSVDNILDHRYIDGVFGRLAADRLDLEIFFEVKANLTHAQLITMRRGGIAAIQPGIESLSTEILRLMRKGVTAAQNIQLLKWSEEIGILPAWNLLAGFPGESPEEYARMAELLPLLTHLEPPTGCMKLRLDRFSPLFTKAADAGICKVRPTHAYYYVYPLDRRELAQLAYFFDFDYEDGRNPETYIIRLQNEVTKWRNERFTDAGTRPKLDAYADGATATVRITDTRSCSVCPDHVLTGLHARLLVECDTGHSLATLVHDSTTNSTCDAVAEALDGLIRDRLMIKIDDRYLSLPVLRNRIPSNAGSSVYVEPHINPSQNSESLPYLRGATG